jgi:hypothetical protein
MSDVKLKSIILYTPRLIGFFSLLTLAAPSLAQDARPYYFYHALPYGTQANYNPLNVIINGGYGILQIRQYSGEEDDLKIADFDYAEWTKSLWQTVGHPIRTINKFGWRRFLSTEVVPLTFNMNNNQWVPNYSLHIIGAGMHSRTTEEWFRYHGFSHPRLWSISTMVAYHVLSEIVENKGNKEITVDHIADLYIFDPIGILLFTNDDVCRFFSEKLHLAEWSMQPAYNFSNGNLENMGQFYVVKYPLSSDKRWSLTVPFGLHGMAGFSHRWSDEHTLSVTAGFLVADLIQAEQDGEGTALKGVLTKRAGVFYDKNNSLLASLMVSTVPENRIRANVYPGILRMGPFSPGFFISGSKEWTVGMSISFVPLGTAQSY